MKQNPALGQIRIFQQLAEGLPGLGVNPIGDAFTEFEANRNLTLTPSVNKLGVAPITISVNDGVNTISTSFPLIVRPSTNLFFNDYFDYADGWIVNNSFKHWNAHSDTATQKVVTENALTGNGGDSEACSALLIGQP